jgi:acyl-CoA reductase-like NAD-dependent aldehyde dehydrogenase
MSRQGSSQCEIFGLVTCFEILDDAIEIDNSLPFAFQAGVFSSDIGPSLRAAQQLDPSAVMIDDHSASTGRLSPGAACRVFICGASIAREKGWNGCQGGARTQSSIKTRL